MERNLMYGELSSEEMAMQMMGLISRNVRKDAPKKTFKAYNADNELIYSNDPADQHTIYETEKILRHETIVMPMPDGEIRSTLVDPEAQRSRAVEDYWMGVDLAHPVEFRHENPYREIPS